MQTGEIIIGLMSGTSVDGIDAALVQFQSRQDITVINTHFIPYDKEIRQEINKLAHSHIDLDGSQLSTLDRKLAEYYAQASNELIEKSAIKTGEISAIANHGQTVRHEPNATPAVSIQLGSPQIIANLTNILTIGKFRQADLSVGGQGAPLMPAFHLDVFGQQDPSSLILNIGGIANLSRLTEDASSEPVVGFDTGPGNTLMDQWIGQCQGKNYDEDGIWAAGGRVNETLLNAMLRDPYFSAPFPKSTGPDYFNLSWLKSIKENLQCSEQDIQATLLQLTSQTICRAIDHLESDHTKIYVCGGGARNVALMRSLADALPNIAVQTTDVLGIPADWVESVGFAWLGYCHLEGFPSNLPSVTGASRKVVLGESYHPASS